MFKPKTILQLKKIVVYPVIWFLAGLLYLLLERGIIGDFNYYPSTGNPYDFQSSLFSIFYGSLITGLLFGVLEVTFFGNILQKKPFVFKVIIKSFLYLLLIFLFLLITTLWTNSIRLNKPVFSDEVFNSFGLFVGNFVFVSIIIYIGVFICLTVFLSEIMGNAGPNVLSNFFLGKYKTPKMEERIFMFLDMKSSTAIAEKLGNIRYYNFLNSYYKSMSDSIINAESEIYQYVGDEIVLSWTLKRGVKSHNCLQIFFDIKNKISLETQKYLDLYGIVPEFKAGLHFGEVTVGEIGQIKKEVLFTGDVLNTTARIQSMCNELEEGLLISDELLSLFSPDLPYKLLDKGSFSLRGKHHETKLFGINTLS